MNLPLHPVRDHYRSVDLVRRLQIALAPFGPEHTALASRQLAGLDQFHIRGLSATTELAALCGVRAQDIVLDVGCGVGGAARYLSECFACRVLGVDPSEDFIEAARYLTQRARLDARVSFEVGGAPGLPVHDQSADVVLLQHVAMNVADRAGLYRDIRRVLRTAGRFASYDVVSCGAEPHYPVPWARSAAGSFLLDAAATRAAIEAAGLRVVAWKDDTPAALAWAQRLRRAGPPSAPGLDVLMGADFPRLAANLARSLRERRVGVVMAVFEAP